VIGGGIVGVSATAFLARAGASVELFERDALAAAASGRNSGSVQHPFDDALVPLHEESLEIYRSLDGFDLPPAPAGVLLLARRPEQLEPLAAGVARDCPELRPALVGWDELAALEPELAPGLAACRLETGFPVRPASATRALAEAARRSGAVVREGAAAEPIVEDGRAGGVVVGGERRRAGAVLVAAGPWTPALVDPAGRWRPIRPVWGAVAEVALERPPRHVLEEAGVEAVAAGEPGSLFSLVTAGGSSAIGSTFSPREPDHAGLAGSLRDAGAAFVPALRDAPITSTRACARPQSSDGRPLIGPVAAADGLHVAAGHGPWGISLGPASGRLAADALLGRADVPAPLAAVRFGWDG
jgi:D-hydroxyproline dehydrogenase subunit beta